MVGTMSIRMRETLQAAFYRTIKGLLTGMQPLMCLQLSGLGESLGTIGKVALVWPFT